MDAQREPRCRVRLHWPKAQADASRQRAGNAALLQAWLKEVDPAVATTLHSRTAVQASLYSMSWLFILAPCPCPYVCLCAQKRSYCRFQACQACQVSGLLAQQVGALPGLLWRTVLCHGTSECCNEGWGGET